MVDPKKQDFWPKSGKKITLKICSEILFFSLLPWAAEMVDTEDWASTPPYF